MNPQIKSVAIAFCFFSVSVLAQDVPFDKANFAGQENKFVVAKMHLDKGIELFFGEPPQYDAAVKSLLKANEFNPDNADLNCKIGLCFMNSGTKFESLPYFEKAFKLKPTVDAKIHFYLGAAYQLNNKFSKAKEEF
jgi:tetratricopeptide (TPR) repeat protein